LPDAAVLFGSALIAVGGTIPSEWTYAFFWAEKAPWQWTLINAGAALSLIAILCRFRHQMTRAGLSTELATIGNDLEKREVQIRALESTVERCFGHIQDLVDAQIASLFIELDLGDYERVSLYRHDSARFITSSRYSRNPELKTPPRPSYPIEGVLGHAWRYGSRELTIVDDAANPEAWLEAQKSNGINKQIGRSLRMRSCCYVGVAVEDHDGSRLGVVVVESTEAAGLDYGSIKATVLEVQLQRRLAQCLKAEVSLGVDPDYASREGF
jgi:hypothetical protein